MAAEQKEILDKSAIPQYARLLRNDVDHQQNQGRFEALNH